MGEVLDCGGKVLDLSRPVVMGILNVTPDSFSDGGRYGDLGRAVVRAWEMVEEGAAIIDVGGESTRPGADPVEEEEELRRVIPVIERLVSEEIPVPLSIDTSKPAVMRAAASAGAGMINDVRALREPGALEAAAESGLPVCLMHMQGEPRSMQQAPVYEHVVAEVTAFLRERISVCISAGIPPERLVVDPGFGFGKTLRHNLTLLAHLDTFQVLGMPLLVGISRKRMLGELTGREMEDRMPAGLAAHLLAVERGARIVRTHDVAPTLDALKVWLAVREIGD
ncbi:MAG TPA: dihydropteroate synthase [Thiotrichales bacterium]|nr:dihydropteroate synthase [Thiotrichales bacterium]